MIRIMRIMRTPFVAGVLRGFTALMFIDFLVYGISGNGWLITYLILGTVFGFLSYLGIRECKPMTIDHQLIGIRGFCLDKDGLLTSLTGRGGWIRGENSAICLNHYDCDGGYGTRADQSHEIPGINCHCGFNVYHSLKDLHRSQYSYSVAAIVRGWGKARLHPDGWRSEYAEILALIDDSALIDDDGFLVRKRYRPVKDRIRLDAASMRYDVPVLTSKQAEQCLLEYGNPVDKKLLPQRRS